MNILITVFSFLVILLAGLKVERKQSISYGFLALVVSILFGLHINNFILPTTAFFWSEMILLFYIISLLEKHE
jgi:hypothetical protein